MNFLDSPMRHSSAGRPLWAFLIFSLFLAFSSSFAFAQDLTDRELIQKFKSPSRAQRSGATEELIIRGRSPETFEALSNLTRTGTFEENYIAWTLLGEMGKGEDVPRLMGLIDLSNKLRAIPAIHALGRIGHPSAVPKLVDILESARDRDIRLVCLSTLGEIGVAGSRGALLHALGSSDLEVSLQAGLALAKTGDPRGCPRARQVLQNEKKPRFLAPALETLGLAGTQDDLDLLSGLEKRRHPAVLVNRAISISGFQLRSRGLSDRAKADSYSDLAKGRDKFIRNWAIRRLSKMGTERSLGHLKVHLEKGGAAGLAAASELRKHGFKLRRDQRRKLHVE